MYSITAKSKDGIKMVATYSEVYDSLMLVDNGKNDKVLFKTKKVAKYNIPGYQSFQRYLSNWKVEEA
jgi:hypothetical protein